MFSEELLELDRNTVEFMIEDMRRQIEEKDEQIKQLDEQSRQLEKNRFLRVEFIGQDHRFCFRTVSFKTCCFQ